jgi:hypothetical protein
MTKQLLAAIFSIAFVSSPVFAAPLAEELVSQAI